MRQAIQAYDALSFGNVVPLLKRALARPELSQADRRAALAYIGRAYAIFREAQLSEAAFFELLQLDPEFMPSPAESPLIREAHARALERFFAAGGARPAPRSTRPEETVTAMSEPQPDEEPFAPMWVYASVGVAVVATAVLVIWRPWERDRPSGTLGTWSLP